MPACRESRQALRHDKKMKNKNRFAAGAFALLVALSGYYSAPANAMPAGWTMTCYGSTAYYSGPNGSYMIWYNSRNCVKP